MHRIAILALLVASARAQNPENPFDKPPAEVDEALRARIAEFFQYHVTGEFRKAEMLVAEDTKDFFYNHNKPRYMSFQIRDVTYSDHFTKAKALVLAEQTIPFPGFEGKPMKVPTPTEWKLVDGKWYWYIDPATLNRFPMGNIPGGEKPSPAPAAPGPAPAGVPMSLASIPMSPDAFLNKVKPETDFISLKIGGSEKLTFRNTAQGWMSLEVQSKPRGVEVIPVRVSVKGGESATFDIKSAPEGFQAGTIQVRIDPTGEIAEIKVSTVK